MYSAEDIGTANDSPHGTTKFDTCFIYCHRSYHRSVSIAKETGELTGHVINLLLFSLLTNWVFHFFFHSVTPTPHLQRVPRSSEESDRLDQKMAADSEVYSDVVGGSLKFKKDFAKPLKKLKKLVTYLYIF